MNRPPETDRKLALKAHEQVKFCSDPVRSEDYFPEWKPALRISSCEALSLKRLLNVGGKNDKAIEDAPGNTINLLKVKFVAHIASLKLF